MRLKSLHLNNFAQHKDRTLTFPDSGVIVIQGSNGAGKSNIVKAIEYALSGKLYVNKADAITWGETEGSVGVEFELNGTVGRITRNLHNANASMTFGSDTYRKSKDVSSKMAELFPASAFSSYVMVRQGELTNFLYSSPMERVQFLHKLVGTDKYQLIHDAITAEHNNFLYIDKPAVSSSDLKLQLDEAKAKLEEAYARVSELKAQQPPVSISDLNKEVAEFKYKLSTIKDPVSGLQASKLKLADCQTQLEVWRKNYDEAVKTYNDFKATFVEVQDAYANHIAARQRYEQNERNRVTLNSYKTELTNLESEIKSLETNCPVYAGSYTESEVADLKQRRAALDAELRTLKTFITSVSHGNGNCPACGTTHIVDTNNNVTAVSELIEKKTKEYNQLAIEHATITNQINNGESSLRVFGDRLKAFNSDLENKRRRVSTLKGVIANISVENLTEPNNDILSLYAQATNAYSNMNTRVSECTIKVASIENTIKALKTTVESQETMWLSIAGFDLEAKQRVIDKATEIFKLLSHAESQHFYLKQSVAKLAETLDTTIALENKARAKEAYRTSLNELRNIFHKSNLPADIATSYMSTIFQTWNKMLAVLDVPFSVESKDELDFQFVFNTGLASVPQLSGGQATCASLAFILTINKLFAKDINFLVLDEPTYGLDAERVDKVVDILRFMQTYAKSIGMQILMITHEERLKDAFDSVITL